jgi:hypothetical protein
MFVINCRNDNNSRNESNNRTDNTVWTLSKAGILAKAVKPATTWRGATAPETIGTSQRQHNMNANNAEIHQKVVRKTKNSQKKR